MGMQILLDLLPNARHDGRTLSAIVVALVLPFPRPLQDRVKTIRGVGHLVQTEIHCLYRPTFVPRPSEDPTSDRNPHFAATVTSTDHHSAVVLLCFRRYYVVDEGLMGDEFDSSGRNLVCLLIPVCETDDQIGSLQTQFPECLWEGHVPS